MPNSTVASLILDLVALIILALCAAYYARKGFVAAVFSFLGSLLALVLASFAAGYMAPIIFNNFFRGQMEESLASTIAEASIVNTDQLLNSLVGFLPESMLEVISNTLSPSLDFSAPDIAQRAVSTVIEPIITPFITIIVFLVLFFIFRLLIGGIRKLATGVARAPIISTANGILGAVTGILVGLLYIFLILCLIWGYDMLNPAEAFGTQYFGNSITWKLLSNFNFFIK